MKTRNRITIAQSQRLSLNMSLTAAIQVLRADAAGLSAWIEQEASANPHLILETSARVWLPRWHDALARISNRSGPGAEAIAGEAAGASLIAHATGFIAGLKLDPAEAALALAFAEALEPSGWLGRPVAEIAAGAEAPKALAEAVLSRLQQIEPAGLFARDLADCLRLQARAAAELDPVMEAVLSRLPAVASGNLRALAAWAGCSEAEIRARIARLRAYDPKPGAAFETGAAPVAEPDLILRNEPGGAVIELNRSSLPALRLADLPKTDLPEVGRIRAREVIRLIEGRNATLLRIGREIFRRQASLASHGLAGLVPMTMGDVAASLNLHQSTVSRMVAGTSVDTMRGTFWLRALFSAAVGKEGPAGAALRDALSRMIAAEDPASPLSDARLAEALAGAGAPLARRTVAKYREMLGIPPAQARKRSAARPIRDAKGRSRG